MSFLCPVCNGLQTISQLCPGCKHTLTDGGRIADFFGPYSPYRPIDELKMTNGFPDLSRHQCVHYAYCSNCNHSVPVAVREWFA